MNTPGLVDAYVNPVFEKFPSIPRLFREIVVTEKIDGTNASILISEDGSVRAGSRQRFITPEQDNFGFARWVKENEDALRDGLGVGRHFGEWYGSGIQRGYGLLNGEKRFALFNVHRWMAMNNLLHFKYGNSARLIPDIAGLGVVPVIAQLPAFDTFAIMRAAAKLQNVGSQVVPGFDKPEGIVVHHSAGNALFKYTFDKNDGHKGA